jgi:hypothetical protein
MTSRDHCSGNQAEQRPTAFPTTIHGLHSEENSANDDRQGAHRGTGHDRVPGEDDDLITPPGTHARVDPEPTYEGTI